MKISEIISHQEVPEVKSVGSRYAPYQGKKGSAELTYTPGEDDPEDSELGVNSLRWSAHPDFVSGDVTGEGISVRPQAFPDPRADANGQFKSNDELQKAIEQFQSKYNASKINWVNPDRADDKKTRAFTVVPMESDAGTLWFGKYLPHSRDAQSRDDAGGAARFTQNDFQNIYKFVSSKNKSSAAIRKSDGTVTDFIRATEISPQDLGFVNETVTVDEIIQRVSSIAGSEDYPAVDMIRQAAQGKNPIQLSLESPEDYRDKGKTNDWQMSDIAVKFAELLHPVALISGGVAGSADLTRAYPKLKSGKIFFPGKGEKKIDSAIVLPDGKKIGISSKNQKGNIARRGSLIDAVEQAKKNHSPVTQDPGFPLLEKLCDTSFNEDQAKLKIPVILGLMSTEMADYVLSLRKDDVVPPGAPAEFQALWDALPNDFRRGEVRGGVADYMLKLAIDRLNTDTKMVGVLNQIAWEDDFVVVRTDGKFKNDQSDRSKINADLRLTLITRDSPAYKAYYNVKNGTFGWRVDKKPENTTRKHGDNIDQVISLARKKPTAGKADELSQIRRNAGLPNDKPAAEIKIPGVTNKTILQTVSQIVPEKQKSAIADIQRVQKLGATDQQIIKSLRDDYL